MRNYLAGPAITGYGSVTVRTTRHDTTHLFGSLRTHLRSHRLRAVVIRNHVRPVAPSVAQRGVAGPGPLQGAASAGPQASRPGLPGRPGTLPQGGSLSAVRPPANLAGWSTRDRLMALLHDTLPLLGPGLRAHIAAMTSTEAVAHLLAGMALMAGLQAVPVVGEAADAVFLGMAYAYAGWDGLRAVVRLVAAARAAVGARSEAEIAHAAPGAADALITLGGAFLDAVALRMAKRSTSGGRTAAAEEEVEQTVNLRRGQGVGNAKVPEARLKGQEYDLRGWHEEPIQYTKRPAAEREALRREFNGRAQPAYLNDVATNNADQLKAGGLTDAEIEGMKQGETPDGYQVHHILPLDDGGTNSPDNLVLTRQSPDHTLLTNYQLDATRGLTAGQTRSLAWPHPDTSSPISPVAPDVGANPTNPDE